MPGAAPQAPPSAPTPSTMRPLSPQAQAQARAVAERATPAAAPSAKATAAAKPTREPTLSDFQDAADIRMGRRKKPGAPGKYVREAARILRDEPDRAPRSVVERIQEYETSVGRSTMTAAQQKAAKMAQTRQKATAEMAAEPMVASPEDAVINKENAIHSAAEAIRGGQPVKTVLDALRDRLGMELSELSRREIKVLTKAILEKGAKGPKK